MRDVLLLGAVAAFFALATAYVRACSAVLAADQPAVRGNPETDTEEVARVD